MKSEYFLFIALLGIMFFAIGTFGLLYYRTEITTPKTKKTANIKIVKNKILKGGSNYVFDKIEGNETLPQKENYTCGHKTLADTTIKNYNPFQ